VHTSIKNLNRGEEWEVKMVGTNVKAETMAMIEKRSGIEAEMNAIIDRLCVPNGPGISGSLLDAEVSLHISSSLL
jgi:26S proteasome non-ATPase regulatory subunit 9